MDLFMIFDGNPTRFIPVIPEKSKFGNLSQKNDKNVTTLHFYLLYSIV